MNFQKLIAVLVIVVIASLLGAEVVFFKDNVARLALEEKMYITVPFTSFYADVNNNLLKFNDLEIFDTNKYSDGSLMSNSDKKLLTKDDLNIYADFKYTLFRFGHNNWDFDLGVHGHAEMYLLDKLYSEMILYGNETNTEYVANAGSGSIGYAFYKASFRYALPDPVNLNLLLNEGNSENKFWQYIKEMPIYAGVNLNLNYPMLMAKVKESSQEFGSFDDSLYYNLKFRYNYFDDSSIGRLTPSFGFGLMTKLPDGWFHFTIDDVFARLICKDLASAEYEEDFHNSLLYFDPDYQPFHESYENDSLRVKREEIHLRPSLMVGFEYRIFKNLLLMGKYKDVEYENMNGFSAGLAWDRKKMLPFEFVVGVKENPYYNLTTGLKLNKFEWLITTTFYNGLFNHAKGFGFGSEFRFNFD